MKDRNDKVETEKSRVKRPYRKPEIRSEEVTERQGLETCRPLPDGEQGCIPIA